MKSKCIFLSFAVFVFLSASMLFANGTQQPGTSAANSKVTLTYWTGLGSKASQQVQSWGEIACWKYIADKCNIDLQFIHPPVGQDAESFNLLLASRTLPDIIYSGWSNFQGVGPAKAINDGIIIDLTPHMQANAPNYLALLDANPEWKRQAITDNGVHYNFPYIYQTRLANSFVGLQIRQDWLDKLNLKMPTNISEWHAALTAFKNRDPNGNGLADEIPFSPSRDHGQAGVSSLAAFRLAFGLSFHFNGFYLDANRKVQYSYLQPAYRDYLETMRTWYAEGLIDSQYMTNDNRALTAQMTNNNVGATYAGYGMGYLGNWTNAMYQKGETNFFLVGAPYPYSADGKNWGFSDPFVTAGGAAVSTSCKYPDRAIQMLDYCYSPEGHLVINFGPDETVYSMVNGKPQYKSEEITRNNPGLPIDSVLIKYGMACNGGTPSVQDEAYSLLVVSTFPGQKIAADNYMQADISWKIPPITPTTAEAAELSSIITEANTLMAEFESRVIMGLEPVSNLDARIATLKGMNIDRAIQIEQAAVDRYYQR